MIKRIILSVVFLFCGFNSHSQENMVRFVKPYTSVFKIDKQIPNSLINFEGNHLFILNKTEWAYFVCKYPEKVLYKAKNQGINVIRVCLEGTPYFDKLGYDLWPWGGSRNKPEWDKFNELYWDQVEDRIRLAGKNGIGINLTIYFNLKPSLKDTIVQKEFWKYIIKRLSKYSNIVCWEIQNEFIKNVDFQEVCGRYFKQNDHFQHPVCTSDGTTDDAALADKDWVDLAIVHTCTGSIPAYDLEHWYLNIARNVYNHFKPAYNNETGREKRHKNDDPVHRRKQSWLTNAARCFWTFHSYEGCEGIDDTTYTGPGAEFLKPLKDFFDSIPFWKMKPNYTTVQVSDTDLVYSTLSELDRSQVISYICSRKSGEIMKNKKIFLRLPDGKYSIRFINPSDLRILQKIEIESRGLKDQQMVEIPKFTDDLLIQSTMKMKKEKSIIKGTE